MVDVDFCVVGAGFAGLAAALRLTQAGCSVAVLEARERVGGRTFTEVLADGAWIDRGGAWIGPGQDRIHALMDEFGVGSYKQYADGEALMIIDGKPFRYKGAVPRSLNPFATVNLGTALLELAKMCRRSRSKRRGTPRRRTSGTPSRSRNGWTTQDNDGVTVRSDDMAVRARRAIVAVPIAVAGQIVYEPMLSVDRSFLHQRMPSGAIFKINVVYDEPSWRADGLSGQSAAPGTPAPVTIDACTDTGTPGVLCVIIEGPSAREMCDLDVAERRRTILAELTNRFGAKADSPVDFAEQNWTTERYSGGGMIRSCAAGRAHRVRACAACPVWPHPQGGHGEFRRHVRLVDGAVRSGERAAAEVMRSELVAVA